MKLPLVITPQFDAIVANLLGDGCFGGFGKTASYKQKNEEARRLFLEKLKDTFGEFQVNQKQYDEQWKVIIPKIIIQALERAYSFEETGTLSRRVPSEIKTKERNSKIAFLAAFIVDEGHVNEGIEIYSGNKLLLQDVLDIVKSLDYEATEIKERKGHRSKNKFYRFRIKISGCKVFLKDLNELCQKYPFCGLAHKQQPLKFAATRIRHKTAHGKTKKRILEILPETKTILQLKESLGLTSSTLREHLQKLVKQKLVIRERREQNRVVWKSLA